jgi:hypothetical protein
LELLTFILLKKPPARGERALLIGEVSCTCCCCCWLLSGNEWLAAAAE